MTTSLIIQCSLLILLVFSGVDAFSTLPVTTRSSSKTSSTTLLPSSIAIPGVRIQQPPNKVVETTEQQQEQESSSSSTILKLTGFSDLSSVLEATPQNELTIVSYHASYCKVCRRAQIKYKKLISSNPQAAAQFTSLEASKIPSVDLKSLGITRFPFIQIWRNGQCVESLAPGASFSYIPRVMEKIEACRERTRTEWLDMAPELEKSQETLERLRQKEEEATTTTTA